MAKRLILKDGEIVYEVRKTHPLLGCFSRIIIAATLIYGPLTIPSPWVYFLAPVTYIIEIIVLRIIWSTKKKGIGASEQEKENHHGNSP